MIRNFSERDLPAVISLWNESVRAGEVVFKELTEEYFREKFSGTPWYEPALSFVYEEDGRVIGFISGNRKRVFLPGETEGNTPGYLTVIFVQKQARGRGVGALLLDALEGAFARLGKTRVQCSGNNPTNLDWVVPGTPGHDHNNAPGMDEDCPAFAFLLARGYTVVCREVAMYLNLADYRESPAVKAFQTSLAEAGIATGRYDPKLQYEFDGMCDRVGSEYWRKVLYDETHAARPRPILAATTEGHIVGFTGPVDKQPSGRGWFTGICTDPLYEKRGIATVLFNLLMQEFIAEGAQFSTLFTGDDNHAQRLYLRTGFQIKRRFSIMTKEINK